MNSNVQSNNVSTITLLHWNFVTVSAKIRYKKEQLPIKLIPAQIDAKPPKRCIEITTENYTWHYRKGYLLANTKHEDAIMKMGLDYFRDTILKAFGIDYAYKDTGPTELVELSIHNLYMDFTFLTTKNFYIHIEFQTTKNGRKDLRRFNAYEAVVHHQTGRKVITYVIYTGGIKHALCELDCGIHTYRIRPVYLREKDADKILRKLRKKVRNNIPLTDADFAQLAMSPLMSTSAERKDTIKAALLLAKQYTDITAQKTIAMVYTLADKFLTGADLEDIKEVVAMTRIGQMLVDEGMEKGMEKGLEEGLEKGLALTKKLLDEKRLTDLEKAAVDKTYREKLMKEYHI